MRFISSAVFRLTIRSLISPGPFGRLCYQLPTGVACDMRPFTLPDFISPS